MGRGAVVSEQPESGAPPRQRPGQGGKILGLSRGQAIGVGLAGLVVVGYLLYRARKNAATQQASTGSTTGGCPDGSSPDAAGNCPQGSQDFSGALETLQSEIADLQGAMAGAGAGGASGGTVDGAGSVSAATGTTTAPPTTAPATTTSPTTPGAVAKAPVSAGPIANLRATQTGTTSFTIAWNPATNASGGYAYTVRDLATHQQVGQPHTTKATSATVTGLKPGTDYNVGLQGLPGGPGTNIHVRTR